MVKFILAFGLLLSTRFAFSETPDFHSRALEIKDTTEKVVANDMDILFARWTEVRPNLGSSSQIKTDVLAKLRADQQALIQVQSVVSGLPEDQMKEVGLDFSSNSKKFSSTFIDHLITKIPGEYAPIIQGQKIVAPKVEWTEIKTLLLYLIGMGEHVTHVGQVSVFAEIQYLYGYEFESFIPTATVKDHFLFDSGVFYMPNSGYVFGGTFRDGVNRGMDCSAYMSDVLQAVYRPSSLLLEVLWKRQFGIAIPQFDAHPEQLDELIQNWFLLDIETEFQGVQIKSSKDLLAGDVVVWRSNKESDIFKKSGHVLMVLEAGKDANSFLGVDLRRDDNQEGHYQDTYHLFIPGKDTFVVRKRILF